MRQIPRRALLSPILKALILLFGVIGQYYTMSGVNFMSAARFMYYTNQSNVWTMGFAAVFLVYDLLGLWRGPEAVEPPRWLLLARYSGTAGVALTFAVFSVLLTPEMVAKGLTSYLFSISNLCVHNLVPLLAVADFLLDARPFPATKRTYLLGAILPLYYVAFALICSFSGVPFGPNKVPYFFFDYDRNGWLALGGGRFGVVYWILVLAAFQLAMSRALVWLRGRCERRGTRGREGRA